MKISEIINYNEIVKAIINEKNIDGLAKFRLLGLCKQFESIVENYEVVRNELIQKYGEYKNGTFGIFEPIKDNYSSDDEYNAAVEKYNVAITGLKNELAIILDSETSIKINKIKYSDIINAGIPADYLLAIYDLIEE